MSFLSGPASLLGIGPQYGDYYQNGNLNNAGTQSLSAMLDAARSGKVNTAGQGLVNGGSLADALKGLNADESAGLAASPIYGQSVAQNEVLNDPVLAGLFGKDGQLAGAEKQANDLSSQGFKLQPQDVEAYGQASGNIARMFGQNEQSLSQALGDRGLAAGGSGAGSAAFSGLMGNKNEQLGQMQMQIANQRMNNTMQRLQQTRNYISQLGGLGQNAEQSAFNNNLNANNQRTNQANDLSAAERGDYVTAEGAKQKSMESQQGAQSQNLGDAISSGLYQGVEAQAGAGTAGLFGSKTNKKNVAGGSSSGGAMAGGAGDPSSVASLAAMMA